MEQITKLVLTGNVDRAVKLCGAAPNAPLAKVIRAGLTRANRGEIEVAKAVEESILENNPHICARIQWLWSLANVATLFGLIGTIVGLIGTFKSLGNVPADQKQALLSKGISEAMNNTAFGLMIAVTCIIFHLFLTAYAKRMIEIVELNAMKLENLLGRRLPARPPRWTSRRRRKAPEGTSRPHALSARSRDHGVLLLKAEDPSRRRKRSRVS